MIYFIATTSGISLAVLAFLLGYVVATKFAVKAPSAPPATLVPPELTDEQKAFQQRFIDEAEAFGQILNFTAEQVYATPEEKDALKEE